jgi:hypothetical protein
MEIGRLGILENSVDQSRGAFQRFLEIGAVGRQAAFANRDILFVERRRTMAAA